MTTRPHAVSSGAMDLVPAGGDDGARLTSLLNEAYGPPEAFLYDGPRTTVEEVGERLARARSPVLRAGDVLDGCVYLESEGARGLPRHAGGRARRQGTGLGHAPREGGRGVPGRARRAAPRDRGPERAAGLFGFYDRLGLPWSPAAGPSSARASASPATTGGHGETTEARKILQAALPPDADLLHAEAGEPAWREV